MTFVKTPTITENKKSLRILVQFFTNFMLRPWVLKKRRILPELTPGSGTPDPWPPLSPNYLLSQPA